MQRFRVTYVRTSYMEIEVEAEDSRGAEGEFETLAATTPSACEGGDSLTIPRYRIVDITPVKTDASNERARCAA